MRFNNNGTGRALVIVWRRNHKVLLQSREEGLLRRRGGAGHQRGPGAPLFPLCGIVSEDRGRLRRRLRRAAQSVIREAFPCVPGKRKPSREAAWGDLEDDDLLPPSQGSFSALVQRDWACLVQDRERVGALYASPVFHAVWLGVANQGRGKTTRATLYLCYGLLAAFTYPVPGSCAEEVAFLKRVRHERDVVSVASAVVSRILVNRAGPGLGYNLRGRRLFMCEIIFKTKTLLHSCVRLRRRLNTIALYL